MSELLIGCGSSREKRMGFAATREEDPGFLDLTTCDFVPTHNPDVVWDLNETPWPWDDDQFDEIHAYEILEHLGKQGDAISFFGTFTEIWRILKPEGILFGTVPAPTSPWVWADPSHTRTILPETFIFLSQQQYEEQIGITSMSDFRHIWHGDFEPVMLEVKDGVFSFALKALKVAA